MNGRDHETEARLNLHNIAAAFSSRQQQYAEASRPPTAESLAPSPMAVLTQVVGLQKQVGELVTAMEKVALGNGVASGTVAIPKARLAELERIEAEAVAAEELARESARVGFWLGRSLLVGNSVENIPNVDGGNPDHEFGSSATTQRACVAKARERIAARASAKGEASTIKPGDFAPAPESDNAER